MKQPNSRAGLDKAIRLWRTATGRESLGCEAVAGNMAGYEQRSLIVMTNLEFSR